jgi:hypothetical protein
LLPNNILLLVSPRSDRAVGHPNITIITTDRWRSMLRERMRLQEGYFIGCSRVCAFSLGRSNNTTSTFYRCHDYAASKDHPQLKQMHRSKQ